jgi:predicted nucleic acid-binding protein
MSSLLQHALSVLHRELGVYGPAQFLRVYRAGTGSYTRDRHQWLLRDANNEMVLEVALSGKADLLVTFNRRDFETIGSAWGIAVVSPQEALRQVRRNDEEE